MMADASYTPCVQIAARTLLAAAPDGRCWLTVIDSSEMIPLPVSAVAVERSTPAASLVEGAIAAGLTRNGRAPTTGSYTLLRYVRWLVGNYVFAGQTPRLFRRAAERFDAAGRRDLAEFARQKATEETGHAELAYRDLEGLGLPAAMVVPLIQPPSANAFADRFRAYVESGEPIALFGFSYCLERMAVERDDAFIRRVEALCPPGSWACRFLKVHSTIGSDSAHVHEQLSRFESLTGAELTSVARAAYETAEMLAQQPLMDEALSDAEIARRLRVAGVDAAYVLRDIPDLPPEKPAG
jgi:pyrroloquinoline quinone (PQQ) biosynthesis protein C